MMEELVELFAKWQSPKSTFSGEKDFLTFYKGFMLECAEINVNDERQKITRLIKALSGKAKNYFEAIFQAPFLKPFFILKII